MTTLSHIAKARGNRELLQKVGRGVMYLGIVHDCVREKISTMKWVDDVCVYLRYEIALREELDLPVSAKEMLYPSYIKITDKDIAKARKAALAADFDSWLVEWDEWKRQLRLESVKDWKALKKSQDTIRGSRISTQLDLHGEPLKDGDIVLYNNKLYSYTQLVDHWVATGMDFNNVQVSIEAFWKQLYRIE